MRCMLLGYNAVMLEHFRLVLLRCAYTPKQPAPSPEHTGVVLRGALGASLFNMACFEPESCPHREGKTSEIRCAFPGSCLYQHIFSNDDPQYLISPVLTDTASFSVSLPLSFYLVLLGRATDHVALLIKTLRSAKPFKIPATLVVESLASYQDPHPSLVFSEDSKGKGDVKLIRAATLLESPTKSVKEVTLEFLTPTYLTKADESKHTRFVKEPDFLLLMQALNRRLKRWAETEGVTYNLPSEVLELAKAVSITGAHLNTVMQSRYSKRQGQSVWLGGVMGSMNFGEVHSQLLAYLRLAEYLHLGKKTVYGNGKIKVHLGE
jgi:CRISPR-associated endoribonuclease Cas6